ncbi:DUF5329 domain-containing protein [Paraliomyxa miuraensis]|nr:DUF5329 domain-containing protein [Paraliomyxa miuraensis]
MGATLAAGCGSPNPRILDATEEDARGMSSAQLGNEMTEQDKIKAIIAAVRRSEHVFVHDDIERGGEATADKLQLLLERDPNGVRSAREFIDRIAAPDRGRNVPSDRVLLSEDEWMLARNWYHARLAELEGRPAPPIDPEQARQAEEHARRLQILDALTIVERSELSFVSPARETLTKTGAGNGDGSAPGPGLKPSAKKAPLAGPKRKPKRKEYTGPQFADMLRKKWEFLGADIHDLDTFIEEIASDSFANMVRYRVVLEDGREEDFGTWLRGRLERERTKIAQGGAP